MTKVTAFLPCRAGSQRVKEKNTRPFAGVAGGLLTIKLRQLDASERIDEILLSTNDEVVIEHAKAVAISKPLKIHRRDDSLARSSTTTDSIILHALDLVHEGELLWTHVTSPLVGGDIYDDAIAQMKLQTTCDSLMSVTALRNFIWTKDGPVNYNRDIEKWPRTQTLEPLYAVNSAIFICPLEIMRAQADRIGKRPYLYELDAIKSIDVDWEDDFLIAEATYRSLFKK